MTRRGFIALGAASAKLRAQTSQERGRALAHEAVQALGGDGFRNMPTRVETGRAYSFYNDQLSGLSIARISTKYREGEAVQRQAFGKKLDDAVLLNFKEAWEVTYRGAKPLGEERARQFRETMLHDVFYILRMRLAEPGFAVESGGRDVVENQPVETLDFYDSENRRTTVWLHHQTLLPVKQTFKLFDPLINDRRDILTRYSKYREVGNGVLWPYDTERERDGEKIFQMYSEKVTVGEDLPNAMFELPAGVKVLKK